LQQRNDLTVARDEDLIGVRVRGFRRVERA
jgi:hypothetical protein